MNKVREGSREWSEAQSEGLRAANGVANDLVLLQTLLVQDRSVTKALDDLEKAGEDGKLVGLRAATVARLKERLKPRRQGKRRYLRLRGLMGAKERRSGRVWVWV